MSLTSNKQFPVSLTRNANASKDNTSALSYHEPVGKEQQQPLPTDLPAFLPYASKQLQLPFVIEVQIKEHEEEDLMKSPIKLHTLVTSANVKSSENVTIKSSSPQTDAPVPAAKSAIILIAELNKSGEVINLTLPKGQRAPRIMFRTIALSLPYQPKLTRLTISSADYISGALIYELAKIIPQSFITELILNDSPVLEANQYLILETAKNLQRLSLDRCRLCDVGIKLIAAALEPPKPAAYMLKDLSVSTNAITDRGVAALTHMLRTNRTLLRLNLSGNQISDKGGVMLLTVLGQFELTQEEKIRTRKKHMEDIKEYNRVLKEIFEKETPAAVLQTNFRRAPSTTRARMTLKISGSVEALYKAKKRLEECKDPFRKPNVAFVDNNLCCLGNMSLCFLNLAYNNIKHGSIVKLREVLWHQNNTLLKDPTLGCGLVRVVIDGNDQFVSKEDLEVISELIEKALERRGSYPVKKRRRESFQSRTSLKSKSKGRS